MQDIWILASNSPRRKALLGLFQHPFQVHPADIDETELAGENPQDYVCRLAQLKSAAVAVPFRDAGLIIAADTTVADGWEILGKPLDEEDARRMLAQLAGRTHQVYTAIALSEPSSGQQVREICRTQVPMRAYMPEEMDAYIRSGDPMDKAGAYAIQHKGFHPVENFAGCFASVMGLPLCHLARAMRKIGIEPGVQIDAACQQYLDYDCPIAKRVLAGENIG